MTTLCLDSRLYHLKIARIIAVQGKYSYRSSPVAQVSTCALLVLLLFFAAHDSKPTPHRLKPVPLKPRIDNALPSI
jgi:hypothetical protein